MNKSRCWAGWTALLLGLLAWGNVGTVLAQDPAQRMTRLEKQLIDLINAERRRGGLAVLQMDPTLSQAAREHSVDMARRGVATHESSLPDHQTPEDRFQWAFGASAAKLTENVAVVKAGLVESAVASSAHAALNGKADAHRNSVDREVSIVGLGCAQGPDGRIWITALFARLAGAPAAHEPTTIAARPEPAPGEGGPPTPERLEELLVRAINEESGSLMLLTVSAQMVDPLLRQAAREHSGEMMHRNLVTHESQIPGHGTPMDRYEWAHGTVPDTPAGSAETVGLYEIVTAAPAAPEKTLVDAFMTVLRGGSRESIKSKRESEWPEEYRRMRDVLLPTLGVGCAAGPDGRYWVTVMYAARPKSILDYVGTLSKDFATLADAVLDMEAGARAGAAQEGRPVKKFEVQWRGTPIHKGDPLPIELRVVRGEKSTTTYGWGGQLSLDVEVGDLNTTEGRFLKADYEFNGKAGKMEPDGRLLGVYQGKGSQLGTADRANSRQPEGFWGESPETQGTWEAVSPDPTRREYQLFVTTEKGRMLAGTLRRKGAPQAEEVAAGLPAATAATAPAPARAAEAEVPAQSEDDDRAADIRWLKSIDEALATAERKMVEARDTLVGLKEIIRQREQRIAYLESLLAKPRTPESDGIIEEIFQKGIDAWDETVNGPRPALGAEPRAVFEGQIARLHQQVSEARKEQDELIQKTLETYYDPIAEELEARGPQSTWDEVRKSAQAAIPEVKSLKGLAEAELYLAAGQDEKFQAAAQASVADGRHAADARYLQAVYFLDKHDLRQALEGFRLVMELTKPAGGSGAPVTTREQAEAMADKGDSLWQQARRMAWMVEDGYLQAVDAKASAEARQVQAEVAERMQKGGDESWIGTVLTYLGTGVVTSTSAIMHQEDALVNLAAKYEKEVASQHCGLLLMQSLHERGFPLDAIDKLTNDQFLAVMRDYYGEAGAKLQAMDGVKLRAAVKAALHNPDVNRLVSGSKEQLRVDTGRDYFGHAALAATSFDSWSNAALLATDVVNMANVAMMAVPMSTYRVSGKLAGVRYTGVMGEAEAGAAVQTTREGFLAATRLNKLPALLEETRAGQVMVGQARQFLANSGWTKKRALEMATFLAAGKTGEAVGGTIGVMRGTDGKTEAEAGRMLAETFTMWTVGDVDALTEASAAHGISPQQLEAVAKQAELEGKAAGEAASAGERHAAAIRETLPSEPGAGISAEGRQAAGRVKAQVSQELQQLERESGAGPAASAAQTKRVAVLTDAFKGAAAAETGAEAEARAWMANVENAAQEAGATKAQAQVVAAQADEAGARLASAETKASPVVEASSEAEGAGANTKIRPDVAVEEKPDAETLVTPDAAIPAAKPKPAARPAPAAAPVNPGMPSLRTGNRLTKDLDQMWIQQRHAEALAGYEERQAALMQLGGAARDADVAAAEIPEKIAALREINELRAEIKPMSKPEGVPDYKTEVKPEEVAQLEAVMQREAGLPLEERTVRLEPVTKNRLNASLTDPYWVYVKKDGEWVKIGIFKRSAKEGLEHGLDLEAEEIYADFAQKFSEKLGVEVPACTRATLTVETRVVKDGGGVKTVEVLEPQPKEGLFVRWAPGMDLEKLGPLAPALFKKQIARDRVLAALFFDYDRKAGNYLVMDLEKLLSLDHGQAFVRGFSGEALESDETVAAFMEEMVKHWRNRQTKPEGLYRLLDEQITIEDMDESIKFVENLFKENPDEVRGILRASQKQSKDLDVEDVLRILTARSRVMRKVLTKCFGTAEDLKPIPMKTVQAEPCRPIGPDRAKSSSAEALALAA